MAKKKTGPRSGDPGVLMIDRNWWKELPLVRDAHLRLPAFADLDASELRLRPDVAAAIERRLRGEYVDPVLSIALRHVLRQGARFLMPRLNREGFRTNPPARTLDLLLADTAAVSLGLKSSGVSIGQARQWPARLPYAEAARIYEARERELLGTDSSWDTVRHYLSGWASRWCCYGQSYPGTRTGEEYCGDATFAIAGWRDSPGREGHTALIAAMQTGLRPGCPVGQAATAAIQPILDSLGPEPDHGRIAAAYRRLLELADTTDTDIEAFLRSVPLEPQVWRIIEVLDAAYQRPPESMGPGVEPPALPATDESSLYLRHAPLGCEVELEFADSELVDKAEKAFESGQYDEVVAAMTDVVSRAPNYFPLAVQLKQGTLLRFWTEADRRYRFPTTGLRAADVRGPLVIRSAWPRAYHLLACALAQVGRWAEAEEALDAGQRLDNNPHFELERAAIRSMWGDADGSLALFEALLAAQPQMEPELEAVARRGMGVHYIDRDRPREAFEALLRADELVPGHPGTQRELAYLVARVVSGGQLQAPLYTSLTAAKPKCTLCGKSAMDDGRATVLGEQNIYLCAECAAHWTHSGAA